ncbi:L,D-transpeptidase family protein [Aliiroseovarius sp. F20344]|uniref:L,D-transpeptidase family protein n=1 Tax=Aliiroseovarius sp. F20344 TaxID=2926414 RepID=UPI001FF4CFD3|nr:L,D-transpeptidase family protein [Aliiroseovarius sp. F20344]MCK0141270.1 L,D-transpeptidase family protein [Aliiroseovarius sp. F20344]
MVVTRWGARFMGRQFPVSIGRGGMTDDKREGDGATPRGVWRLVGGGYRADRLPHPDSPLSLGAIGPKDIWSDDPNDPAYNHGLRASDYSHSHEKMRMTARLYDVVLFSDWNYPNVTPGKGSAIFVHQWRKPRHPTAGCLAFAPKDLHWIMQRWTVQSRIIVR